MTTRGGDGEAASGRDGGRTPAEGRGKRSRKPALADAWLPFEEASTPAATGPSGDEARVSLAPLLAATPPPRRVFLGWERPILSAAAAWILAELGTELQDVLVAVPGARAARRLRELLAESAPDAWTPPRVLTQGELIDELVQLERPPAGRLTRTLVWERALAELDEAQRACLRRARADDTEERLRLAETVRTLHGELAPEDRDFASLGASRWEEALESEAARWEALSAAQATYRALLARLGLVDPHEGRARAIDAGEVEHGQRVVLVGVADMNHLLARLLERLSGRVHVLVAAPEELAEGFDVFGRLRVDFWRARDVPLDLAHWRVAEKPVDQAEAVRAVLAEWSVPAENAPATHELTLGVADESVVPYLERQLAECGAGARLAAGTALEGTRPHRLLRALARFLRRGGFAELAALARDPDLGEALAREHDPAGSFDAYFEEHLPRHARDWLGDHGSTRAVRAFQEGLERSLGPLASGVRRPLAAWSDPIRAFLGRVYARALGRTVESERVLAEALRGVGAVLAELEEVPDSLELSEVGAAEALELVLRALRGRRVPPPEPGAVAGPLGAVELVGWLDLVLDDAPALILTGFNEGKIPQSQGAHAFLPDSLRQRLGLPGDAERLARDAYAATVILETRARCAFVTGRRSAEGDPLVPSRLAFHRPEAEIPGRVARFLPERETHAEPEAELASGPGHACPLPAGWSVPTRLSVSAFRSYLSSPYTFFLEQVLRLGSRDDRVTELDPRRFGIFAHAVLQELGQGGPHDSGDAREVEEFLVGALRRRAADEFGPEPLPAVGLQLHQLEYRLRAFAVHQAERAAAGWRIHAVEWKPPSPVLLEVDGVPLEIAAKIDRVDRHPDGRWAILDYKTGEGKRNPREAHRRRSGEWTDLQLPLYRFVGRALGLSGEPELGYAWIGKDEVDTGFFIEPWQADELEEALEVARDVVRAVRAGSFETVGRLPYDEILRAICGQSALGQASEEVGE